MATALKSPFAFVAFALVSWALPAGAAQPHAAGAGDDPALSQAKEIQALHEPDLFRVKGVNAVGLGKDAAGQWVLHVYAGAEADRQALPERVGGMEVVIFEGDRFVAADTCSAGQGSCPRSPAGCQHRQPFSFPVPSGVSTSNGLKCEAGTIGFRVCDAGNPNIVGYITNNHVAAADSSGCPNGAPPAEPQYQPGRCDLSCNLGSNIGALERYVPLISPGNNRVDAAFVRSDAQRISGHILDIGQPTSNPRDPMEDETVRKSGSTTGFTQGTVQTINISAPVFYCEDVHFIGQILVVPASFAAGGDSGSPVVDVNNNPVGLFFARNSSQAIVNPITRVLDELGVTFDCSAPPPAENHADFLAQSHVPTQMNPGQQLPVWLTFRNIGTTTWTSAELDRLGSQSPPNNPHWGFDRMQLPHDVGPQAEVTFQTTITAPTNPATYDYRWRMVKDGVGEWFGEQSQNVQVTVGGGGPCPPLTAPQGVTPQGPVDDPTPTFSWTPVPGATTYTLYVQYPNGDVIRRAADIATNSYVPTEPLPLITNLIWKVKGECGVGLPPYSPHLPFRVLFGDVPANHWARAWIEFLYGPPWYVSENLGLDPQGRVVFGAESGLLRKHAARWLLRAKLGPAYVPPPAVGIFADVPPNSELAPWIEDLFNRGITAGCGQGVFCPDAPVTRGQAAVLWLRTVQGTAYQPPPCVTPTFTDVPCSLAIAPWVEELHRRDIAGGCADGLYCPDAPLSRAAGSVFTYEAFWTLGPP